MNYKNHLAGLLLVLIPWIPAQGQNSTDPAIKQGADIFQQRCVLCHGSRGMGEGNLPLTLPNYPYSNLVKPKFGTDPSSIRKAIQVGGSDGSMSQYSPPWEGELSPQEIDALVAFILALRENTESTLAIIASSGGDSNTGLISVDIGKQTFKVRCTLCHGKEGHGDGKMAKIIKNPPPFNLTLSGLPDEYLFEIISKGGQDVGRSPKMPPFGGDFSSDEIKSLILFLKTIRKY